MMRQPRPLIHPHIPEGAMSRFWSETVRGLTPYVPGEQPKVPDLIKLNTNENPYGPSPGVLATLRAEAAETLRLYPDPNADRLKAAVAEYYRVRPNQVFAANGSDEALAHAFLGLLKHPKPLLFPDVTYSFYPVYCGLYGIEYETVPLTGDFEIDLDDYLRPNGGVIFANPNAPTGRLLSLDAIEAFLAQNTDSVVVVDEAYIDFGGETAIPLVERFPNLLVIQTLSKSRSLAGLRVGFAVGHTELIEALERVKNSFNSYPLGRLSIAGAVAAMEDREHFDETRKAVIRTREVMTASLQHLGFTVLPSAANFVFARHPEWNAATLAARLREKKILVRHFKLPRIDQFLRISVGSNDAALRLHQALSEILDQ